MSEHEVGGTDRRRWPPAYGHGRVFALGVAVLLGVGATTAGITWASGHGNPKPIADISPIPAVDPGSCLLQVGTRPHSMDVDRARTLTMIAGVGTQIGAVAQQTARAFDIALADRSKYLPSVNTALTVLAQDDTVAPTAGSLAEIAAVSRPGALSCTFTPARAPAPQHQGSDGLTARADAVRTSVLDAFGKLQVGGAPAAHPAGAALTVWLAPVNTTKLATGWVLANWLVARGSTYGLGAISFDDHTWRPTVGWNTGNALPTASASAAAGGRPAGKAPSGIAQTAPGHDLGQLQILVN
jgi:hypothetical protein